MAASEPKLSDYRLTTKQYALYKGDRTAKPSGYIFLTLYICVALAVIAIVYVSSGDFAKAVSDGLQAAILYCVPTGIVAYLLGCAATSSVFDYRRRQLLRQTTVGEQVRRYEDAWQVYFEAARVTHAQERVLWKRQQEAARDTAIKRHKAAQLSTMAERAPWLSYSGVEFERALANLLEGLGYHVQLTPTSGDGGIDLVVKREGKTTVVQCKQHRSRSDPAVVRELYGVMIAFKAHKALLACTGGFTKGARSFAQGKPILLWSIDDLVQWGEEANKREPQGL